MVSDTIDFGIEPDASTGVSGRVGSMRHFVTKGVRLPIRRSLGFQTPNAIQTGDVADEFRIPMLRGKHGRAEGNHPIGVVVITAPEIRRDLSADSQMKITLSMEVSGQVRMQAYIPSSDGEWDITFNPQMSHKSQAELRAEYAGLRLRMAFLREKVDLLESVRIHSVLARVEGERFDSKSLIAAAENDADAVQHRDRRLPEFAAALDDLEFLPKRAQHREAAVVVAHDNENPEQQ